MHDDQIDEGPESARGLGIKVPADVASGFASALMQAEDEAGRGGVEARSKH
ncbi:MAG TPA: hypothetical protein VJU15_12885 [Gemmatimonadales bacterium]|nr:hypothetical protein [Gemmatimonadales bacterium]